MVLGYKGRQENVTNVNNGLDAINEIQKAFEEKDPARFSLILIECKMSLIDGYETIKRIRRLYEGIGLPKNCWPKLVATTCLTEPVYQKRAYTCGFETVLTKPLSIHEFGSLCQDLSLIDSIPSVVNNLHNDGY